MNGTVMKITKTQIVVLCEDGKFRNIPHPQELPVLGDNIEIPVKKSIHWPKSWMAAAAVAALVIGVSIFLSILSSNQPVAWVAIDINPSVELAIHPDGKVKDVTLHNDEADLILDAKELIKQDIYQAMELIIHHSEKQGFLDPNTQNQVIMISTAGIDDTFQIDFHKTLSANYPYHISMHDLEKDKQKAAQELDLSLNKYVVLEKTKELGVSLDVDHLRSQSIVHTLEQAGIDPQHFFGVPDSNEISVRPEDGAHNEPAPVVETPKIQEPEKDAHNVPPPVVETPKAQEPEKDTHNEPAPVVEIPKIQEPEKDAHNVPAPVVETPKAQEPEKDTHNMPAPVVEPNNREDVVVEQEPKTFLTIDEFELEVELRKQGRQEKKRDDEYEYKYKSSKPNAQMEALLNQLELQDGMSKEQIADRVMTVFQIDRSQIKELEIEIKFSNGREIEIEIERQHKDRDDDDDDEHNKRNDKDWENDRRKDRDKHERGDDRAKNKKERKDQRKNNHR